MICNGVGAAQPVLPNQREAESKPSFGFLSWFKFSMVNSGTKSFAERLQAYETKDHPIRHYLNFCWHASSEAKTATEKALLDRHGGLPFSTAASLHFEQAEAFLQSQKGMTEVERQECQTILKQRGLLSKLTRIIETSAVEESVAAILSSAQALRNPHSADVVFVKHPEGNYTSFSFPGGSGRSWTRLPHGVLFEMRYYLASDQFLFLMHNRGKGIRYQGPLRILYAANKYCKTTVAIKATQKQLTDKDFLAELICLRFSAGDMQEVFAVLFKHFGSEAPFLISPLEKEVLQRHSELRVLKKDIEELQKAREKSENVTRQIKELVEKKFALENHIIQQEEKLVATDPHFHSIILFGSCVRASLTGPEKLMASDNTRRKVKLFAVELLARKLSDMKSDSSQQAEDKAMALQHSEARIGELRAKCGIESVTNMFSQMNLQASAL